MLLAAAQFFATPFGLVRNLDTAERLVRQAAENGAQLVVLPAQCATGYAYTPRLAAAGEYLRGATVRRLAELSVELDIVVAAGLLLRAGDRRYSALVMACPDGSVSAYHQRQVCLWERGYYEPGRSAGIVTTPLGRLGLLMGWEAASPRAWEQLAGQVDAVIVASAAPRFHRAVLNFPLGRKVYVGQLVPALMRQRDALDALFARPLAAQAARLGVPVAHAAMSGRFVTTLPFPRLSFLAAGLDQPRYWPLAGQAHLASLRATFYGDSAILDAQGAVAAQVDGEEGIALAEVAPRPARPGRLAPAPPPPALPPTVRLLARLLRPLTARAYDRLRAGQA